MLHRTPSMREFQELMKSDAKSNLKSELDKLCYTAPETKRQVGLKLYRMS